MNIKNKKIFFLKKKKLKVGEDVFFNQIIYLKKKAEAEERSRRRIRMSHSLANIQLAGYPVILGLGGGLMAGVAGVLAILAVITKSRLAPAAGVGALGIVALGFALSSQPESRINDWSDLVLAVGNQTDRAVVHLPAILAGVFHACAFAFLFLDYYQPTTTKGWLPLALFVASVVALTFSGAFITPRAGKQSYLFFGRLSPLIRVIVLLAATTCLVAFPFILKHIDLVKKPPILIAPFLALTGYILCGIASGLSQ